MERMLQKTKNRVVVLVPHQGPDADCLASCWIIKELIKKQDPNKRVYLLLEGASYPVPWAKSLDFTDIKLINNNNLVGIADREGVTAFIVDHSDRAFSYLKNWDAAYITEMKVVDHHIYYGAAPSKAELFIDDKAHSTTEVLYDILEKDNFKDMNPQIATAIYQGLFCDCFRLKKPLLNKHIDLIHTLIHKFGLDIKKSGNYVKGEHLTRAKALGEIIFLSTNKSKNSNTANVILPYAKLEKMKKQFVSVNCVQEYLYRMPYTDHVLIRYEPKPGRGSVRLTTQDEGLLPKWKDFYPAKHDYHTWSFLTQKQAVDLCKQIRHRLKQGDATKSPENLGDLISKLEIEEKELEIPEDDVYMEEMDVEL